MVGFIIKKNRKVFFKYFLMFCFFLLIVKFYSLNFILLFWGYFRKRVIFFYEFGVNVIIEFIKRVGDFEK